MFTGLVEALADVIDCVADGPGRRLRLRRPEVAADVKIGDSIAVNGCCLTVVDQSDDVLAFDVGPETLERTNLGELAPDDRVNIERSLRVGTELGGHFVSGHVDAVGTVESRRDDGEWSTFWFTMPASLARQMISKGSIAVDGVSLTLVDVEPERFSVMLIPHTLSMTTLGHAQAGTRVNLETDLLAKYVERQLECRSG
ncbi:MAG: riboflavin synthase [Pirellulales bacterium]